MTQDDINPQDKMALEIEKRRQETESDMFKEIKRIFKKSHVGLTKEEKGFLQARVSYLTKAEREEYKAELAEDLTKNTQTLDDLTRKELVAKANELGIESPEKFENKQQLIDAILAAQ